MARIGPAKKVPWYIRLFFLNQKRKYGAVLEPARLWARSPKVFMGVALLFGALDRRSSPIPPVLRSLITVRVSQINWCRFCVDINSMMVLRRGAEQAKLDALEHFRESDLFSEAEKAALHYAEVMTRSDLQVTDADVDALRAHFSEDAIVELTGLIAFQNLSSKFNAALDVAPQGFCKVPPKPDKRASGRLI
ncbi:carboxymuconolactone decarboxylase family protein [Hahella sp. SMD15-11]|uniref:Carboxymuconolactone decarboxylase family protein n=1 Tax=Thermohahella caldifontis TaxID=3142973 RepID=A0AB39UTI0_9GAMM